MRRSLDKPALTTDVIVGFPGETEEDFAATCRVAEEVGFSKMHIFPFSPRRTTPAATMPDQVDAGVKAERARRLADLERQLRKQYFESLVGRELEVLAESHSEATAMLAGTACRYAPVELPADAARVGRFVRVTAQSVADDRLQAVPSA
mgnify:CR=1 FL=1